MTPPRRSGGSPPVVRLTRARLAEAVSELAGNDADMARVIDRHGFPPLWARPPGFATLVHIILEQQVSLASARAAYTRLADAVGKVTPEAVLALDDDTFRACGFSRQKTGYARDLAATIADGRLCLRSLSRLSDDEARVALTRVRGIGRWTADIYLLMALRRADVWPRGDLALVVAIREVKGLDSRPGPEAFAAMGEPYRPWRAAAARVLWHHYLSTPRRRAAPASGR